MKVSEFKALMLTVIEDCDNNDADVCIILNDDEGKPYECIVEDIVFNGRDVIIT